jgi:tetratricopeptide (TPR) repeat protein
MQAKSKRQKRPAAPAVANPAAVRVLEACVLAGIFAALLTPLIYTGATICPFVYPSETARLQLWMAAWDGFLQRPLLGWGPGGYEAAFDVVFRPAFHPLDCQDRAHNVLLGTICETGAVGALAYLAMWVSFAVAAVRAARTSALTWRQGAALLGAGAGYFVHSLFAPEGIATDLMIAVTFAAVAVSTAAAPSERPADESPMGPKRLVLLGIASASALAVLWFGSLSPFLSSYFAKKAMSAATSSNGDQLIAWLDEAQSFRTPYVDDKLATTIGIAEESVRPDSVRTSAQKGTLVGLTLKLTSDYLHAYPSHARYRTHLADALVTIGRGSGRKEMEEQAESLYLQSIAESPSRQRYRFAYAKFLTKSGRQDQAEEQYRKALDAAPGMGKSIWSLGRFLWSVRGQVEEGSRLMTQSIEVATYDRFWPESPLEWLQLAEALAKQHRTDLLRGLLTSLRLLATDPMSAKACVEIAKVMEDSGLIAERDDLVQLAINRNASLGVTLGELLGGRKRLRDGDPRAAAP